MTSVALTSIATGFNDTFENNFVMPSSLSAELVQVFWQNYDELTEGVVNTPAVQFFWDNMAPVSVGSETDRHTFGGASTPVRQKEFEFHINLLLDQKSFVHKIFTHMLPLVDAINDVLESQNQKPYFGVTGIQAYTFEAVRTDFEYGGALFPGVDWTIFIRVF